MHNCQRMLLNLSSLIRASKRSSLIGLFLNSAGGRFFSPPLVRETSLLLRNGCYSAINHILLWRPWTYQTVGNTFALEGFGEVGYLSWECHLVFSCEALSGSCHSRLCFLLAVASHLMFVTHRGDHVPCHLFPSLWLRIRILLFLRTWCYH